MGANWQEGYAFKSSWTGVDWASVSNNDERPRIDPYLVWADATDYVDLGGRPETKPQLGPDGKKTIPDQKMWVPVIIELAKTHKEFVTLITANEPWKAWMRVSPLYLKPPTYLEQTRFFTAMVCREFFAELGGELGRYIARFELGLPMRPFEGDPGALRVDPDSRPGPNIAYRPAGGADAVVGIIDDGLAFAHERFLGKNGESRIGYFWNQGYPVPPGSLMTSAERPGYGWEFTNADIERLMSQCRRGGGLVDEDAVYRMADYREVARSWAHGTHVMDLACGSDPAAVDARSPHIICVQLQPPSRTTRDRSSGWLAVHALDGLRYILDRATKLERPALPVIVNLSFGHIAGPHDGSSMLEEAIHELIEARRNANLPLEVVVAAGNSLQSRCHASVTLGARETARETRTLAWRVLPDDATPSFMEIWLSSRDAEVDVEVETPWGDKSGFVRHGEVRTWRPHRDVLGAIIRLGRSATGDPKMILLAVAPTQRLDRKEKVAPCGTWSVRVRNRGSAPVKIEAYIERDETPHGFPRRGRQSRFDDPNYERFDKFGRLKQDDAKEDPKSKAPASYIKRANTINSIATGPHTVVIAGYRGSDRATVTYSSNGPQISAAGVSEDSVTSHGILAAGSRSGARVAMNGTSVAAPQLTRVLAERLARRPARTDPNQPGRPTGRKIVEDFAAAEENQGPVGVIAAAGATVQHPGPPLRKERLGKGRADARTNRPAIRRRIGDPPGG